MTRAIITQWIDDLHFGFAETAPGGSVFVYHRTPLPRGTVIEFDLWRGPRGQAARTVTIDADCSFSFPGEG